MVHAPENCGFARSYIIEYLGDLAVVDPGSVGAAHDLAGFITRKLGLSLPRIRCILVTHFHIDHLGGVGRLLRYC
ncbi:MAG: MBL fold metallo-hydrolase [Smithellaceae bacterium]|nr:MBL fold metallo-hydrolase [Smithellaceae bacterium]